MFGSGGRNRVFTRLLRKKAEAAASRRHIGNSTKQAPVQRTGQGRHASRLKDVYLQSRTRDHREDISVSVADKGGHVYITSDLQRGEEKFDYSKVLATELGYTCRPTIYVDEVIADELDLSTIAAEITDALGRSLSLHIIAQFKPGFISLATVRGADIPDTLWITYAGHGKDVIRRQPGDERLEPNVDGIFFEDLFDSPEAALDAINQKLPPSPR